MADTDDIKDYGSVDPIVPVDFTPHTDTSGGFRFKLRWVHVLAVVFAIASGTVFWFLLTAKSIFIEAQPITAVVELEGSFLFKLGPRYLARTGTYQVSLNNEGYHALQADLVVDDEQSQTHSYVMRKLPGLVSIQTPDLEAARVQVDAVDVGETPLTDIEIEPGEHVVTIAKERYLPYQFEIDIEGRSVQQSFEATLEPAWAVVSMTSEPIGAEILVDGEVIGVTPMNSEILQGNRDVTIKLAGHKAWRDDIEVAAGQDFSLPTVTLEPADGLVFIRSVPNDAGVTINGSFVGQTPLQVALAPEQLHELTLFRDGYFSNKSSLRTAADEEKEITIELQAELASVEVITQPEGADLYVNGELRGPANQTLELLAAAQRIEVRKEGYVPYSTEFTSRPGLDQVIRVSLKSLEQARLEQIKPIISSATGEQLKLFYPTAFTMGASRREPGRRPNETLRDIELERPFYLSFKEVSNAEFKQFNSEHSSGTLQGQSLDSPSQPVVRVTWNDAALFCNWLSEQEGLAPFYMETDGEVVSFNLESYGYRLPTEAEWAWAARRQDDGNLLKFPWGLTLPPSDGSGNYADLSSRSYLGEIIANYDDGFLSTAPTGYFQPNHHGLYDLGGNVAEWVHDFYGAAGSIGGVEQDPAGPEAGEYHVIRGSSWAHGSVTELRLSFRDFGSEPRDDVGFRVARYLED